VKTIETTAPVSADHTLNLTVRLATDVPPGDHRVLVVVDEGLIPKPAELSLNDWPRHDVGPWPEGLSLRREDMYGDFGR
jgi:hypothetical protein